MVTRRPAVLATVMLSAMVMFACAHPRQAVHLPGTATVRGRISDRETGRPLPHAIVRANIRDSGIFRVCTADQEGRYELNDLLPGSYELNASDDHYLMTWYDQQVATDAPKLLEVRMGQTIETIDLKLSRAGVINGRVVDEYGEPVPNVLVGAKRFRSSPGGRELRTAGSGPQFTDDKGEYRIFELDPGDYVVSTDVSRSAISVPGAKDGYAITFFPGTATLADAQRLTVGVGSSVEHANITLVPATLTNISGTVVDSSGQLLKSGSVFASEITRTTMSAPRGTIRPDGSFSINGVAPGEYMLHANMADVQRPGTDGVASQRISVTGRDLTGIRLAFVRASAISGRILVDPAATASLTRSYTTIMMNSLEPQTGSGSGRINADLTFTGTASAGRQVIRLQNIPPGLALKSIRFNGEDVTDGTILVEPHQDIAGIEIELTDRVTTVSGKVTGENGTTPPGYTVVVFARDQRRWNRFSRYVATAQPNADGRFALSGMPPGEYYAAAINGNRPQEARDEEFLTRLRGAAVTISLADGETQTVDLKLTMGL